MRILKLTALGILLVLLLTLIACGSDADTELTRQDVEQMVQQALQEQGISPTEAEEIVRRVAREQDAPDAGEVEAIARRIAAEQGGLDAGEVETIVRQAVEEALGDQAARDKALAEQIDASIENALAGIPAPEPGLSEEEVRAIAAQAAAHALATVPQKSDPPGYTKFVVDNAIARYDSEGLDAALAHPNRTRICLDLNGWVGTDANGNNFGPAMLSATGDGKWVSYVFKNPETGGIGPGDFGEFQLKNVWVVRHEGLLFASGWYIDADEFTKQLVSVAVDQFRAGGLLATIAYFASPDNALAGLEAAIDYYNQAETIDGRRFAPIADPTGQVVTHSDTESIGMNTRAIFGGAAPDDPGDGA